jgi:hypothetical protein
MISRHPEIPLVFNPLSFDAQSLFSAPRARRAAETRRDLVLERLPLSSPPLR